MYVREGIKQMWYPFHALRVMNNKSKKEIWPVSSLYTVEFHVHRIKLTVLQFKIRSIF